MNQQVENGRSIAQVLSDTKDELKQFVDTRIAMLKTELQEKLKMLKVAAPLAAAGVVLLVTAYLLFTLSLVGLVFAFLPNNDFRWCLALFAVAVLWSLLGGVAAYFAKREFELKGVIPNRTIRVLKGDKIWIQAEVKNRI
jgi:Putative Actinobacterial Holin-X, holin superfamily III